MVMKTMTNKQINSAVQILSEPSLEFRYGQRVTDPRDGLSLFGPFDADTSSHPDSLSYGVVGTKKGIELFQRWSEAMGSAWTEAPHDNTQKWPPYPGFRVAFNSDWRSEPVWTLPLDDRKLSDAARRHDRYERVYSVVNQYLVAFEGLSKLDERIDVMVCVVPEEVHRNCRTESAVTDFTGERVTSQRINQRRQGQSEMLSSFDPEQYELSPDFRRQIKARSMKYGVPIQIVRETTLTFVKDKKFGQEVAPHVSSKMWHLGSALYYKGGGKPWKLATAREGVCYVGLAFRRSDPHGTNTTAACAAQMFLNDGDGVVFLGEYGPWYSPKNNQYHLTAEAAHDLLKGTLETYKQLHGKPLTEVFLHSRSDISEEEFDGYRSAALGNMKVVGVRVRSDPYGPRLYRPDKEWPVLRGTLWRQSPTRAYLYGTGFKPRLGTYDGSETPVPLRIDVQHGEADITEVAQDILGLTKLNYNACNAGDSQPVTVKFSDAVGEILVSNSTIKERQQTFKFYI